MTLILVNSRAIRAVGFDGYTLFVQFHTSNKTFSHPGVPYGVYVEFIKAPSLGKFYCQFIRGRYR